MFEKSNGIIRMDYTEFDTDDFSELIRLLEDEEFPVEVEVPGRIVTLESDDDLDLLLDGWHLNRIAENNFVRGLEWTSVEDDLPPEGERVLIAWDHPMGFPFVRTDSREYPSGEDDEPMFYPERSGNGQTLAWMSLPIPPESTDEDDQGLYSIKKGLYSIKSPEDAIGLANLLAEKFGCGTEVIEFRKNPLIVRVQVGLCEHSIIVEGAPAKECTWRITDGDGWTIGGSNDILSVIEEVRSTFQKEINKLNEEANFYRKFLGQ